MSLRITFWGASGTVTGSKYLIQCQDNTGTDRKLLIDAGLFQGDREWRERNWEDPSQKVLEEISACLLTHAHIDHTGILPRYYRLGLRCPVYATKASSELTQLLLPDSAALQEEEAAYRVKSGKSRHHPPLPLYTKEDAQGALTLLRSVPWRKPFTLFPGIEAEWRPMGHILGAASIRLRIGEKIICFSGDIGRYAVPILRDPEPLEMGDLLLVESTYGDSFHGNENPMAHLARVINETYKRKGVLLIPSFAVGRTQTLLFYLRELKERQQIPDIPIIIDSPMATDATAIYERNPADYDENSLHILKEGKKPFSPARLFYTRDRQDSIKLNDVQDPMILISASGMLSGGRILHHLRNRISQPQNTILFVGFQPPGSRGAWIKSGADSLRIFGSEVSIRAQIDEVSGLSAHADQAELLRWCKECQGRPGKVAVVHGEPDSAKIFREKLEQELGWDAFVAKYQQTFEL